MEVTGYVDNIEGLEERIKEEMKGIEAIKEDLNSKIDTLSSLKSYLFMLKNGWTIGCTLRLMEKYQQRSLQYKKKDGKLLGFNNDSNGNVASFILAHETSDGKLLKITVNATRSDEMEVVTEPTQCSHS